MFARRPGLERIIRKTIMIMIVPLQWSDHCLTVIFFKLGAHDSTEVVHVHGCTV